MAFGLIQWLMSFVIFFVVLSIITWSAVHLGQKDHQLLDRDNYSNHTENKSLNSTIVINVTSPVMESINDMTQLNDPGMEVADRAQFYKVLQVLSIKEYAVNSTRDDAADSTATAILTSSVIDHDSNEDVTAAAYNMSAESVIVNHSSSIGEEVMKSSTRTPQTAHSTISYEYRVSPDTERSRKSDLYPPDEMEFFDSSRNKENGISNASAAFSFVRLSPGAKQTNIMKHMERTDTTHISQNEQLEIETSIIPPYFYVTIYTTEDP
ncbi:uncharacterized protein LOC116846302 isoform X2 [Odontomachus brunneus]|uniref:uncharacterized protein LOC116846302 isoform X2 n=1 Tax=Odontomachus brunneus TaxID=486640 RepID=UPI0013F1B3B0|nr:uncharacterized protein LOC116846302 isoform X2 [Odontomachus brunneus]